MHNERKANSPNAIVCPGGNGNRSLLRVFTFESGEPQG